MVVHVLGVAREVKFCIKLTDLDNDNINDDNDYVSAPTFYFACPIVPPQALSRTSVAALRSHVLQGVPQAFPRH